MVRILIFILVSSFLLSCGDENNSGIPFQATVKANGLLENFTGKLVFHLYENKKPDGSPLNCTELKADNENTLKNTLVDELVSLTLEINYNYNPKYDESKLRNIEISTGRKLLYAELFDNSATPQKIGHACETVVKCEYLGNSSVTNANEIEKGDKACVILNLEAN